ncbi:MAG: LamG-like jellyroll fold domain-containing protein, partial [Candidatus Pacearchaeota archaeon]
NSSGVLDFNETYLNSTIDDRDDFEVDTNLSGASPSSGDLTGTYPNIDVKNNSITLKEDNITDLSHTTDTNLTGESAGGDLSGTYPDPSVNWTTGNYEILLSEENITDENWLEEGQNNVTFLNYSNEGNINVTSGFDVCIEGGNCLSDVGGGSSNWNVSNGKIFPEETSYNASIGDNETYGNRFQVDGSANITGASYSESASLGTSQNSDRLTVNGTSNFLNNTIMNISQINTGNSTINLTYYNLTETSTSTSIESLSTSPLDSLKEFNEGSYTRTSASRDANSGDLGLGYRNGSNSGIGYDGLWRFDTDIPPSKNVTNYGSYGDVFNSTANFGYDPTTSGVFSTDSYDFDPNNNGGSVKVNLVYPSLQGSGGALKQYTLAGWIWRDNWGTSSDETWLSATGTSSNTISLSKEAENLTFNSQSIQGANRLSHDVGGQTGWLHYAVVYDQGTAELFVNGSKVDTTSVTAPINRTGNLVIGKERSSSNYNWTAKIDEVILEGSSLSDDTVRDYLYFTGSTQTAAGGPLRFQGDYEGPIINNSESSDWQNLTVNSTVRANTKLNVTFNSLDSSGNTIDNETFSLSGSEETFDLSTLNDSNNASLSFNGSSSVPSETWEVESYSVDYNENNTTTTTNSTTNPKYVFENSDVEINGILNVTGNVTSQTDFCIEEGKCLSDSSFGRWNLSSKDLHLEDTNYNVSIGGTDASSKLDVQGDTEISGEINPETNTSFGKGTQIQTNQKHCLDGSSCNHYIKYNGSATIIE